MPTENSYLDGTGSFVSTATNAGTVKFASFDDSAVNTGVIAVSATFAGTAVNSGVIGDVFPTQYATFLANNSANWDSTYNTVSDLSATWSAGGGGGGGGAADLTAISDVSATWDSAYSFVVNTSADLVMTSDARLTDSRTPLTHTHGISAVTGLQTALDAKQASGDYATLVDGKVPSNQLPSYVDDVIEAASTNDFPATGESSKIYVATGVNKTYRWSGSAYIEISPSPGSTDSVTEGSTNLYFTDARAVNALQTTVNTLSTAIDGKQASGSYANATHTHAISDVTGLQTALDAITVPVTTVKSLNTTSYTLLSGDINCMLRYNSSVDTVVTIPLNVMSVGAQIIFAQVGVGKINFVTESGVTRLAVLSASKTSGQYSVASILQTAQNEWFLTGDVI